MEPNFDLTSLLRQAARQSPHGVAFLHQGASITYAELEKKCAQLACGLRKLGLPDGARVGILADNCPAYVESIFSILWANLVVVPLNNRWSISELTYAINDCEIGALIVDNNYVDMLPSITQQSPSLKYVLDLDKNKNTEINVERISWEDLCSSSCRLPDPLVIGDRLAGIFYTGGTTGYPKGAMLSHGNIWCGSMLIGRAVDVDESTRYLHVAPMFHLADTAMVFSVTSNKAQHAFVEKFDAEQFVNTVEQLKITNTVLVPTMISRVLDTVHGNEERLSSMKQLIYGTAPMPIQLIKRLQASLPWVDLIQAYGQTELAPVATVLTSRCHSLVQSKPEIAKSAGRPVPGIELKICDKYESEVPRGEVGEIVVRGPNAIRGYWGRLEETRKAIRSGWLWTGDLGYLDKEGYLYVVDRAKDMIISGGENVYSAEVERVIERFNGVIECAVIGVNDEDLGERVHAVVFAEYEFSLSELQDYCRDYIAGYKLPRSIEFSETPLPRSGVGKVLKRSLKN